MPSGSVNQGKSLPYRRFWAKLQSMQESTQLFRHGKVGHIRGRCEGLHGVYFETAGNEELRYLEKKE